MDARSHQGLWLLRIDDLDTPRNMPGAAQAIMDSLLACGLRWDGEVYYQSRHLADYEAALNCLQLHLYACTCSRKDLADYPGVYPGFCRHRSPLGNADYALRVKTADRMIGFRDGIQGEILLNPATQHGDFIIKRRDGVIAYQLAVVVDDHAQRVNRIVRGYDLLDSTPKQIFLQKLLGYPQPAYLHVPVIVDQHGQKLSKQTGACGVDLSRPEMTLYQLLCLLRQEPPPSLRSATLAGILAWGVSHWRPERLINRQAVLQTTAPEFTEL